MTRFLFLILLLLFAPDLCGRLRAAVPPLPATFSPIGSLASVHEGDYYLVGGVIEGGQLALLSSRLKSNNKVAGSAAFEQVGEGVQVATDDCLWQLEAVGSGTWRLRSVAQGKYLARRSDKLGLRWVAEAGEQTVWELTETEQGTIVCAAPGQNERSLSVVKDMEGSGSSFDNYTHASYKTDDLHFYQYGASHAGSGGQAEMPADGVRVAFVADGQYFSAEGKAASAADAQLCDGTLAAVEGLGVWTAEVRDAHSFALKAESGYLDYQLQRSATPSVWQISEGYVCTAETEPRYLSLNSATGAWQLDADPAAGRAVGFQAVAEAPERTVNAQGVCTLRGGWSATALADLDWTGVRCLDLTQAVLPRSPLNFRRSADTRNLPLFVAEAMADVVPSAWSFVVKCGSRNELLRSAVLHDREAFYTDRSFHVGAAALIYERTGCTPGQWQTLCLPHAATLEVGQAYALAEVQADTLLFVETSQLEAGEGYIVLPDAAGRLRAVSDGGNIQGENLFDGRLRGVYSPWVVGASDAGVRFLTPDGLSFRRAAAGSRLAPFRAFLELGGDTRMSVRLKKH